MKFYRELHTKLPAKLLHDHRTAGARKGGSLQNLQFEM